MAEVKVSVDKQALGLVRDQSVGKVLGTCFSLLRPQWYVTAKHVVLERGAPRTELECLPNAGGVLPAQVVFVHPEVDLAVLQVASSRVATPLFPSFAGFTGGKGLICAGYAPSLENGTGALHTFVNFIPSFTSESRRRSFGQEELITFEAPFVEGGHSGGPIFGEGGGVVGVVIESFLEGAVLRGRATGLRPLLDHLVFSSPTAAT